MRALSDLKTAMKCGRWARRQGSPARSSAACPGTTEASPATEAPAATAAPTAPAATAAPATPDPTAAPARTWEEDVWVQGGWIQRHTLASQGGTIYAYLGDEGALYAFDREAGTKSLALPQGNMGRQMLYYLTEQNGLLCAGGVGGSGSCLGVTVSCSVTVRSGTSWPALPSRFW